MLMNEFLATLPYLLPLANVVISKWKGARTPSQKECLNALFLLSFIYSSNIC